MQVSVDIGVDGIAEGIGKTQGIVCGAIVHGLDMQWNTGDFNLDNTTDVADLGILGANWSASQATGNASALVSEPTTLSLLAMSVLMVGRRRR